MNKGLILFIGTVAVLVLAYNIVQKYGIFEVLVFLFIAVSIILLFLFIQGVRNNG